jgi:hypothetical protein
MDYLSAIFTSPAVWSAILLLANLIVKYMLPDFPTDILNAINALAIAVLAAVGIGDVRATVKRARDLRAYEALVDDMLEADDDDEWDKPA